ncbi:c2 domain-containing protein [Anaeramoeba ignava]|uniref:C2 domain-containing protein n=1 Tax=Anaeramoeba ignava TaxID=1746090 RepID=A0A9Q0R770_ANAIG|nr:c2 domain-containing protein [Anaeramoeba ignava]
MSHPTTPIHVRLIEAKGLKSADIGGKSDPYVTLSINGIRPFHKSKIQKATLDPVWNEDFQLNVKDPDKDIVLIGISDWDRIGAHDLLGFIRLRVSEFLNREPHDIWRDCEGRKPGTKEKGKVHMVIHYLPKGIPFEVEKKHTKIEQQPQVQIQQQPQVQIQQQPQFQPQYQQQPQFQQQQPQFQYQQQQQPQFQPQYQQQQQPQMGFGMQMQQPQMGFGMQMQQPQMGFGMQMPQPQMDFGMQMQQPSMLNPMSGFGLAVTGFSTPDQYKKKHKKKKSSSS